MSVNRETDNRKQHYICLKQAPISNNSLVIVGEARLPGGRGVVEMGVEHVEAVERHLRVGDRNNAIRARGGARSLSVAVHPD